MTPITIPSGHGSIRCEQFGGPGTQAVLWVFGAGGGFGGPAAGVYARLAEQLVPAGMWSLCVDYQRPGYLEPCVADVQSALEYMEDNEARQVILVGHSFGGAVVIQAALRSVSVVIGIAALSSQSYGTKGVEKLSPRPLLLIHGEQDETLPPQCSRDIYRRAREPKTLILYPRCMHGLDQCIEALDRDLKAWLLRVFEARVTSAD